jgi:hypothetical protein
MRAPYLDLDSLVFIPLALAVAFMAWAFWNFCRAAGRR